MYAADNNEWYPICGIAIDENGNDTGRTHENFHYIPTTTADKLVPYVSEGGMLGIMTCPSN